MSSISKVLVAQDPLPFLLCAVPVFLLAFGAVWMLGRSQLGMASNLARLARLEKQAVPLVPMKSLTKVLLSVAFLLAVSSGALQGLYTGRVDPNVFRIENAIPVLVATLAGGRNHWRAALVAVGFFIFPDLFADLIGYQRSALAQFREIALGILIMIVAGRQWARSEARQ
jgi:ABC-type branched-subunit amino acid transport system permease subunit